MTRETTALRGRPFKSTISSWPFTNRWRVGVMTQGSFFALRFAPSFRFAIALDLVRRRRRLKHSLHDRFGRIQCSFVRWRFGAHAPDSSARGLPAQHAGQEGRRLNRQSTRNRDELRDVQAPLTRLNPRDLASMQADADRKLILGEARFPARGHNDGHDRAVPFSAQGLHSSPIARSTSS